MNEKVSVRCDCKDCKSERAALQKQLDHPFYKKVDDFRGEVKVEALTKAAKKYKEPFNPASWSIRQLGKHAMAENYDQGNYLVGLMDAAEALEAQVAKLERDFEFAIHEGEFWRAKAIYLEDQLKKLHINKKGLIVDEKA